MNEVYFKSSPFGDLKIEYVIVEDLYPILFVLTDENDNRYLCVCCEIREEQRWIISPISKSDLVDLLTNRLFLYNAFDCKREKLFVAIRDYNSLEERFVGFSDDNILDLPTQSEYLDADASEHNAYITKIKSRMVESFYRNVGVATTNYSPDKNNYTFSFNKRSKCSYRDWKMKGNESVA